MTREAWEPTATPGVFVRILSSGTPSYMVRWEYRRKRKSRTFATYEAAIDYKRRRQAISGTDALGRVKGGGLSADPDKRANSIANLKGVTYTPEAQSARATVHGGYAQVSKARLDAKVKVVFDALAADAPVQERGGLPAADTVAVEQLATTLCRLDDVSDYLSRRGWEGEDGRPRPVLDYEARLRAHLLDLLKELGMTPASRAKLGLDLARGQSAQQRLDDHLRQTYGAGS